MCNLQIRYHFQYNSCVKDQLVLPEGYSQISVEGYRKKDTKLHTMSARMLESLAGCLTELCARAEKIWCTFVSCTKRVPNIDWRSTKYCAPTLFFMVINILNVFFSNRSETYPQPLNMVYISNKKTNPLCFNIHFDEETINGSHITITPAKLWLCTNYTPDLRNVFCNLLGNKLKQ